MVLIPVNLGPFAAIKVAEGTAEQLPERIYRGGRITRTVSIIIFMLVAWLATPLVSHGQEEEIYFQSDYQQEVQDEQVLLLQGNCEVHFREFIIYADEVRLNDEKDEFFGVGNVRVLGADRDIFADSVWYNYARDDFDMRNTRGSMLVGGVSEPVWFRAERLRGNIDDFKMINGRVTTCSPDEDREYHIEARSIKILRDNKVIFRNGYMFILNVPILWFPYWAYSIAETPWVVDVGKNAYDGVYVKTRYNYLGEELIIGVLIMEYYSRRGWRFGSEHEYLVERHGVGSIDWDVTLGTYRNESTGEVSHATTYSVNLSQPVRFGSRFTASVGFRANSRYNLSRGRTNDISGSVSGNYNTANTQTRFNFNGSTTSGASQSSNITLSLSHNRTIFENVTTSGSIDYKVSKQGDRGAADEQFKFHAEFRQSAQGRGWSWNAKVDSHWDPDGFTNANDRNLGYTDRLPEINVTFQPNAFPGLYRNWLGFEMQNLNLQGGLYYIGPEDSERNGFYGRMDTRFTRRDELGASHNIQSNADFWQAISSTGDARYVYSTRVNWTWDISKKLTWKLNWNRQDTEGRIPLQGLDRPGNPNNRLGWNLNFQNGRLYTIRLSTGYVLNEKYARAPGEMWSIRRLQPLQLSFNYTPGQRFKLSMSTQYDIAEGDLGDIRTQFSLTDFASYRLDSTVNFKPPGTISRFSTNATFIIGDDWDFEVSTEFASQASESIIRSVQMTHRLDCTFLTFKYTTQNDYWGFTWGVTGFPKASLGYSTTEEAFGPGIFNTFSGSGSGFSGGGFSFSGGGGNYGGGGYPGFGNY